MKSDSILHWGAINSLLLIIGKFSTAISQLYVSRILSPVEFANANIAICILGVFVTFSSVGMTDAVPTMGKFRFSVLGSILPLSLFINCTLMILLIFSSFIFGSFYHSKLLINLLIISSFSFPLIALSTRPTCEQKIKMKFKRITISTFCVNIFCAIATIALAKCGFSSISLILPLVLCQIIQILIIYTPGEHYEDENIDEKDPYRRLLKVTSFYWVINFLLGLQLSLPILILGTKFDKDSLGYFIWGSMFATQFSYVVSNSLRGMYMPKIASIYANNIDSGDRTIVKLSTALHAIFLPIILLQALWFPIIIPEIFGNKWNPSIHTVELISIGQIFLCWNSVSFCIYSAKANYFWLFVQLLAQVIFILLGSIGSIYFQEYTNYLVASSFLLGSIISMCFTLNQLNKHIKKLAIDHLIITFFAIVLIVPIFFVHSLLIITLSTLTAVFFYIILCRKYLFELRVIS
jgi:O-antigen/teichoic acid export membrane protein